MTTTRLLGDLTGVSYDDLVEAFGEPRRCDRSEKDYVEWRIETPEDGVVSIYDQGRDGDFHGGGRLTLTDVHVRLRRWRMNGGRVDVDRAVAWVIEQVGADGATWALDPVR